MRSAALLQWVDELRMYWCTGLPVEALSRAVSVAGRIQGTVVVETQGRFHIVPLRVLAAVVLAYRLSGRAALPADVCSAVSCIYGIDGARNFIKAYREAAAAAWAAASGAGLKVGRPQLRELVEELAKRAGAADRVEEAVYLAELAARGLDPLAAAGAAVVASGGSARAVAELLCTSYRSVLRWAKRLTRSVPLLMSGPAPP